MRFPQFNWRGFFLATGISLVLPLAALAVSQGAAACAGAPGADGGRMPPYLHGLDLNEAQRDKVFEIMHAQAPAMRDRFKAARNVEESLRKLVLSPDYDESKASELAGQAARAMADLTLARARAERQVYELLTPEQRKQLLERKVSGESPMGGHDDGHRPHGY